MADFHKSIASLRARATSARRRAILVGLMIFTLVAYAFTFIAYSYIQKSKSPFEHWANSATEKSITTKSSKPLWRIQKQYSPPTIFDNRIEQVLSQSLGRSADNLESWLFTSAGDNKPAIVNKYNPKELQANLEPLLLGLERYSKATQSQKREEVVNDKVDYVAIIPAFFLSLGAVAFTFLLIQTAFTFIRYFVRLAELYDAQADALEASDGDPKVAYAFIEKFSPLGVDFGRLPVSVYEKSFDAVLELAKSKGNS
jgi:hypothetical protein